MMAPQLKVGSRSGGKKARAAGGGNSTPGNRQSSFDAIGHFALEKLNEFIREFMDRVDDAFFERSDKAGNDRERQRYFEAMREIRIKRGELQQRFDGQMRRSLTNLAHCSARTLEYGEDEDSTGIEAEQTEDRIAIDSLISRARQQYRNELAVTAERLGTLLGLAGLQADENPLDPAAICENFHIASELLEIDIQARLIFYKLFEKQIVNQLDGFYHAFNTRFAQLDPAPVDGATNPQHSARAACKVSSSRPAPPHRPVAAPRTHDEPIVDALTRLQKAADTRQSPGAGEPSKTGRSIRQRLDALCRQYRHRLSTDESQRIDAVSMLFDFFCDDEALPAAVKQSIGRLQVPILKLSLLDPNFLIRKSHPARRLLDRISRAALGRDENHEDTRALIGKIDAIVELIVADFARDVAVFERACADFENFIVRENKKRARTEAQLRQQERQRDRRVKAARDAAAALIQKLVKNRDLDPEILRFLHTTWTSVLFRTYLSLGESSNHWRNLRRISTTLVWTLVPRHSEEERNRIIKTIPALLRALARGMALINTDMEVQNRIFAVLAREHASIVRQTSRNIVTRVDDTTVWPEDAAANAFARAAEIDVGKAVGDSVDEAASGMEPEAGESDEDSVTLFDTIETNEVIKNLNQFTACVREGRIRIDEEIVLSSAEDDFDLEEQSDESLEQAMELAPGNWVEFIRPDATRQVLSLCWKSKATGNLMFVNGNGNKVKNMTVYGLAAELRSGRARCIETTSVFDRAFYKITTKLQH